MRIIEVRIDAVQTTRGMRVGNHVHLEGGVTTELAVTMLRRLADRLEEGAGVEVSRS